MLIITEVRAMCVGGLRENASAVRSVRGVCADGVEFYRLPLLLHATRAVGGKR